MNRTGSYMLKDHTIISLILEYGKKYPDKIIHTFLSSDKKDTHTYSQLISNAKTIASHLLTHSDPGSTALILLPPGLKYICAFLGCLFAGIIAVPAYPPRSARHLIRLNALVKDANAKVILTTDEIATNYSFDTTRILVINDELLSASREVSLPETHQSDIAFLQYTSGSTGLPKGVIVSHGNIIANMSLIDDLTHMNEKSLLCSWLPPFHDMGLIGGILYPLYSRSGSILMSPVTFINTPYLWLKTISDYQIYISPAPNFAYDLCVRAITEEQKSLLDLSSWKIALNGAEPVNEATLHRFTESFKNTGFKAKAFYPSFGMAETTLMISGKIPGAPNKMCHLNKEALKNNQVILQQDADDTTRTLLSCGPTNKAQVVKIYDYERLRTLGDYQIGEIIVSGPTVAQGYWQKPELTQEIFHLKLPNEKDDFLRTGDLGFLDEEGNLYITGRLKDLIILNGQNIYPQDIEYSIASCHSQLLPQSAVFALDNDKELVIVQEVHRRAKEFSPIFAAIVERCFTEHQITPNRIVLIKQGSLPKTSSGKVQRSACKQELLHNQLKIVAQWDISQFKQDNSPRKIVNKDLEQWMIQWFVDNLDMESQAINPQVNFAYYNVNSIIASQFCVALEQHINQAVNPALLWEYSTIELLAEHLTTTNKHQETASQSQTAFQMDPKALIGMSCRFPGRVNSPEEFWELLCQAKQGIIPVPEDRWDIEDYYDPDLSHLGTINSRKGGFIENIDQFDASFFGINTKEAEAMDPQHRLLLELTWEALERANIVPADLFNTNTGIFIGISSNDYSHLDESSPKSISSYYGIGNAHSAAAGRLSYYLGTKGPTLAVDTACSSSLVAVFNACQSLQEGLCDLAIVGGVNALLDPKVSITFSQAGMLSPSDKCSVFDATADGYVRSEGCGVIILKRQTDAERDRDHIIATICGGYLNSDGHSNGLTAPNPEAQSELIKKALISAKLTPDEIGYIEAHGTGTRLGDPIEFRALQHVFASKARTHPLYVGAVKSNLGHLEAAAGIAGLIKTALILYHQHIPANVNFHNINPLIDLPSIPAQIPTQLVKWETTQQNHYAGVSSFGFTGTNAHLILGRKPEQEQPSPVSAPIRPLNIFTLSAPTKDALMMQKEKLLHFLKNNPELDVARVCQTYNVHRSHLNYRLAVACDNMTTLINTLSDNDGRDSTENPVGELVFLFSEGSYNPQTSWSLYNTHPVFKAHIDRCCTLIAPYIPSLFDILFQRNMNELSSETNYAEAALFTLEYSLAQLWISWGVKPAAVIGYGLGEYIAATIAESISLNDGLRLIAHRCKLMHSRKKEALFEEFRQITQEITYHPPKIALISNSTGQPLSSIDASYWTHNLLEPFDFTTPFKTLSTQYHSFMEIGPQTVLLKNAEFSPTKNKSLWFVSMETDVPEWETITNTLIKLYLHGQKVDWDAFNKPFGIKAYQNKLPVYSFQNAHFWQQHLREKSNKSLSNFLDHSLYSQEWEKISLVSVKQENSLSGCWWVFINDNDDSLNFATQFGLHCEKPIFIHPGKEYQIDATTVYIDPAKLESYLKPSDELPLPTGIIFAWNIQPEPSSTPLKSLLAMQQSCFGLTSLIKVLSFNKINPLLWVVTQGAVAPTTGQSINPFASALLGVSKVLAIDLPTLKAHHLDIGSSPYKFAADLLVHCISSSIEEPMLALHEGSLYAPYLTPFKITYPKSIASFTEGTYIITGGLGGIGKALCLRLIEQGAQNLVILGRRHFNDAIKNEISDLAIKDTVIHYMQTDLANFEQLKTVFQKIIKTMPSVRGIFHTAGLLSDAHILNVTPEQFLDVFQAKINGSLNLHLLSTELKLNLKYFVLFSSISSLFGTPGQANYAAANAFMDGLAHLRKNMGLNALSINFGPWHEVGMTQGLDKIWQHSGIEDIPLNKGINALISLLDNPEAQICIMPFKPTPEHGQKWPKNYQKMLRKLITVNEDKEVKPSKENLQSDRFNDLTTASLEQKRVYCQNVLYQAIRNLLGTDNSVELSPDLTLIELGLDSLASVELLHEIKKQFPADITLSINSLLFEKNTLHTLVNNLADQLHQDAPKITPTQPVVQQLDPNLTSPLSFQQIRIWNYTQLQPDNPAYLISNTYHIETAVYEKKLESCIQQVMKRHSVLRSSFHAYLGAAIQLCNQDFEFTLKIIDLTQYSLKQQKIELNKELTRIPTDLFNLAKAPLLASSLIKLAENKYIWSVTIHHIITDGNSTLTLMKEIIQLYESHDADLPVSVPYQSFIHWQLHHLTTESFRSHLDFWRERLSSVTRPQLITDSVSEKNIFLGALKYDMSFTDDLKMLLAMCKKYKVTLPGLLLGLSALVLSSVSSSPASYIMVLSIGNITEFKNTIGPIANEIPLFIPYDDSASFIQWIRVLQENLNQTLDHQEVQPEQIASLGLAIPDVSFDFQTIKSNKNNGPLSLQPVPVTPLSPHLPLWGTDPRKISFKFMHKDSFLSGSIKYRADLFHETTIKKLGEHLLKILRQIEDDPHVIISQLIHYPSGEHK